MVRTKILSAIRSAAFQGEFGAFGEAAALTLWPDAEAIPLRSVADVTRAVARNDVDAGVLAVENTVAGTVVASYDALVAEPALHVIGESVLQIHQCLLGCPGATLDDIEVVESHPVALAQCGVFLARLPHLSHQVASDTAGAARAVAESRDTRRAAIASEHAARRYGLVVLAEHVEDRPDNQTRFLAIARDVLEIEAGTPARTSLVFTTGDVPGALLNALKPVARHQLNLTKLESRPTGEPWSYRFFADIDCVAGDPRLDAAIAEMITVTHTCRILGTYARALS